MPKWLEVVLGTPSWGWEGRDFWVGAEVERLVAKELDRTQPRSQGAPGFLLERRRIPRLCLRAERCPQAKDTTPSLRILSASLFLSPHPTEKPHDALEVVTC